MSNEDIMSQVERDTDLLLSMPWEYRAQELIAIKMENPDYYFLINQKMQEIREQQQGTM